MLRVRRTGPNRVDIHVEGMIDAREAACGLDALAAASEGVERGRILYRIAGTARPTLGAVASELVRLPRLVRLLKRYERCAILADAPAASGPDGPRTTTILGVEIRVFPLDQAVAAEWWLGGWAGREAECGASSEPIGKRRGPA